MKINTVIDHLLREESAVLCGAGLSYNSGLPTVAQIVPYILSKFAIRRDHLDRIYDDGEGLKMPFELFISICSELRNLHDIYRIYDNGEPSTNHILLAKLMRSGKISLICTTNFDMLIEKALLNEGMIENRDYKLYYNTNSFVDIDWGAHVPRVIKIHGSVQDTETMAITLSEIARENQIHKISKIMEHLLKSNSHSNVIVLGYSCSDKFDVTPQIESMSDSNKYVFVVDHVSGMGIDDVVVGPISSLNPFRNYKNAYIIKCDANQLIRLLWCHSGLSEEYSFIVNTTSWKNCVDNWFEKELNSGSHPTTEGIVALLLYHLSEYRLSEEHMKNALKISEDGIDKVQEAIWLGNLGLVAASQNNHKTALKYFDKSMRILETCSLDKGVADIIFNMAGSVLDLGSIDLSEKLYRRALSEYNSHFDKLGKGKVLVNFAPICHKEGKTKEAVDYLQTAIGIFDEFGYLYYLSIALGTLANIHLDQKQYEEALKCFDEAVSISFKIGDKQGQADWTGGLGNALLLSAKEYQTAERAVRCYERAIELASQIDDKVGKGRWLRNMSKAYQHMCNPVIARELLEEAVTLLEPILGAKNADVISARKDLKKLRNPKYCINLAMGMEP